MNAADFFTCTNLRKKHDDFIRLTNLISDQLNLKIAPNITVFSCDGRDGIVNYVYDPAKTVFDSERMNEKDDIGYHYVPLENNAYSNYSTSELYKLRNRLTAKCIAIEQSYIVNSLSLEEQTKNNYVATLNALKTVLSAINDRMFSSTSIQQTILSSYATTGLYEMIAHQKGTVTVELYRSFDVYEKPVKVAVFQIPYSSKTTFHDLFSQIGFDDQEDNIIDPNTLDYIWIDVPYFETEKEMLWGLDYHNITVEQFLMFYHYDRIYIRPYDYHMHGGIGHAGSDLLMELYAQVNTFLINHPIVAAVIGNCVYDLLKNGSKKLKEYITQLEERRADYSKLLKSIQSKDIWKLEELQQKFKIQDKDSLEFIMFGLGYVLDDNVFIPIEKKESMMKKIDK